MSYTANVEVRLINSGGTSYVGHTFIQTPNLDGHGGITVDSVGCPDTQDPAHLDPADWHAVPREFGDEHRIRVFLDEDATGPTQLITDGSVFTLSCTWVFNTGNESLIITVEKEP